MSRKSYHKWTDEEIATLYRMEDGGYTYDDAMEVFGVSRHKVQGICYQLGIILRRRRDFAVSVEDEIAARAEGT